MEVYRRLFDAYGPQHWWPGAETPIEVCIGAILTQSAAWTNVELAMRRLREAGALSLEGIHASTQEDLAELVHASGYFNVKARKLKAFAQHVYDHHGGDLDAMLAQPWEPLREELLGIYGIGEETADDIVLYAANAPSFVMDAYTRRILSREWASVPPTSVTRAIAPSSWTPSRRTRTSTTSTTRCSTTSARKPVASAPPAAPSARC